MRRKAGPLAEFVEILAGGEAGSQCDKRFVFHLDETDLAALGQWMVRVEKKNRIIVVIQNLKTSLIFYRGGVSEGLAIRKSYLYRQLGSWISSSRSAV